MANKGLLWIHLSIFCAEIVIQFDSKKKANSAEAEYDLLRDDVIDRHYIRNFPFINNLSIF